MPTPPNLNPAELATVSRYLAERFSLPELKTLAEELGVDYEKLAHNTKDEFALELLKYAGRTQTTAELLALALRERPDPEISSLLEQIKNGTTSSPNQTTNQSGSPPQSAPQINHNYYGNYNYFNK